jgi:ArsR family transcriptional regulator
MEEKLIPTNNQCEHVAEILKVLAHPQRLLILCQLSGEPKSVGDLEKLSGASQSAVSQFLGKMKAQGLVKCQKQNQFTYYEIADLKVKQLIQSLYSIYCDSEPKLN